MCDGLPSTRWEAMKRKIERKKMSRLRQHLTRFVASVIIAGIWSPALAQDIQTSPDVHGVIGRVTYSVPPEVRRFQFSKYPNPTYCRESAPSELVDGDLRVLHTIEVDVDRGLKGAIVALTDILDLKFVAKFQGTEVVVENCRFSPFTGVIVKRRGLRLENRDADPTDPNYVKGLVHTGHSFEVVGQSSRTLFNASLLEKGSRLDRSVDLRINDFELFIRLRCDMHEWENAYFLPVTNPYYATVEDDGSFVIKGVPPGRHRIVAWHPFAGRAEADIVIDELGSVQVNFELRKRESRLSE